MNDEDLIARIRVRWDAMNGAFHVEINQVYVAAFASKPEAEQMAGFIRSALTSLLSDALRDGLAHASVEVLALHADSGSARAFRENAYAHLRALAKGLGG